MLIRFATPTARYRVYRSMTSCAAASHGRSVKRGAACHSILCESQRVQQTFRVDCAGLFCHANQGRGTGKALKAATPPAGAQRGIWCVQNHHVAGFCRCAGVAGQQSASQHHATANTRAERDNHSTLRALSAACQRFAQHGHIGIVSDIHLHTGFAFR